jgi:hypothetical protein
VRFDHVANIIVNADQTAKFRARQFSVQKIGLNESVRIIISLRFEKEGKNASEGTNVSP